MNSNLFADIHTIQRIAFASENVCVCNKAIIRNIFAVRNKRYSNYIIISMCESRLINIKYQLLVVWVRFYAARTHQMDRLIDFQPGAVAR